MKRFFFRYRAADGSGIGAGWVQAGVWNSFAAGHVAGIAVGELDLAAYNALRGRARDWKWSAGAAIAKAKIQLSADKPAFKGDGADTVAITWSAPAPVNITINGIALANNPHDNGFSLTWDVAQRLTIEIDDGDYCCDPLELEAQ
jgi:hypothetical protein